VAGHSGRVGVAESDGVLVQEIRGLLARLAMTHRHHIAAGLYLADGTVVTGINLVSNYGPNSLCAEQAAIAEWAKSANPAISTVAAIRATFDAEHPYELVPPCGRCRELVYEYAPDSCFLIPGRGREPELVRVPARELLPSPFRRRTMSTSLKGHIETA
jgi:cytidine deaminase